MEIIILVITIPFTFVLVFFIFLFLFNKFQKKQYDEIESIIENKKFSSTITTLKLIDTTLLRKEQSKEEEIYNNNPTLNEEELNKTIEDDLDLIQLKNDKENFASRLNKIEKEIKKIKNLYDKGIDYLNKRRLFKSYSIIKKINDSLNILNQIKLSTKKESKQYIEDFETLNKELWKYRNIFKREILPIIENWKLDSTISVEFINQINYKITQINDINNNIETLLEKQNPRKAKELFELYKKNMYEILYFANYFDTFICTLFKDSEKKFTKLENYYNLIKRNMNSSLDYIEFYTYFEKSKKIWKEAIKNFEQINVNKTKELINDFEKILINLTMSLNNEVKSNNFLTSEKCKDIYFWYNDAIKKNIEIQKMIKDAIDLDPIYFDWLKFESKKMSDSLLELKDIISKIKEDETKDISRVSKQYKYKSFMYIIKSFNEIYFHSKKEINIFYSEGLSSRLKFNRIKNIILKMEAFIQVNSIVLSKEDLDIKKLNQKKRNEIDKYISNKNQSEEALNFKIKEFEENSIEFLLRLGKKIIIVNAYKKINETYSYKRLKNPSLHEVFSYTENLFMEGQYENSLLLIIDAISREAF